MLFTADRRETVSFDKSSFRGSLCRFILAFTLKYINIRSASRLARPWRHRTVYAHVLVAYVALPHFPMPQVIRISRLYILREIPNWTTFDSAFIIRRTINVMVFLIKGYLVNQCMGKLTNLSQPSTGLSMV